nr:hypothetical protein BaRGS_035030 [Batillaria attramentaria]
MNEEKKIYPQTQIIHARQSNKRSNGATEEIRFAHAPWGENRDVTKVKKRQLRKTAAKYTIREDVLYHDGILVAKRNQVPEILQEFHDNYVSGGHLGMNKTYKKVLERYFWHGMKQEVEDYCRSCCVCQNMNACRKKPAAPLHPIPVPKKKWSLVGMDIIGPLQVTDRGNQYIVALTDHFTKFPVAKAIPCKSSEEVARFMYETICIFGAFDSLITDQGREFINFALDILTDRFNINHRISSAYHPETNGQRERDNRTLKDTLVKITDNDDWDELLPAALFAYRTSVHKSTQFSPFLALYGEQAKLPFDVTGDANEQDLNEEIMDTMKGIHEEVKNKIGENISRAQKKQKEYYDSRRAYDHGFRIGDKVLIINAARVHRMGGKMAPRFVGPYEARLQWAQGHLNWNNVRWQNVLFSDASRFCIGHADGRVRVWRRRGDRYADNCVVENNAWGGPSLMLWGAIGHNQVLGPVIFQGLGPRRGIGITAQRYMDQVLHLHVLPFFQAHGNWVFQHDNARPHTARATQDLLQRSGIQVMPWPALSPDMNPIEQFWDLLQTLLNRVVPRPTTVAELDRAVRQAWANIPRAASNTLVRSMTRRCQAVIDANGGHTRY